MGISTTIGIGLDNQKHNLRRATKQQNSANRGPNKNNTSGRKGVYPKNGRWAASIQFNRKVIYLGTYDDVDLASAIYFEKAKELFGEFARI